MTSVLERVVQTACTGGMTYSFCRLYEHSQPFQKAVFTTIFIGLQHLGRHVMSKLKIKSPSLYIFLVLSSDLLAIPGALYVMWKFNKAAKERQDYFHLVGISYVALHFTQAVLTIPDLVIYQIS